MKRNLILAFCLLLFLTSYPQSKKWHAGFARRAITPNTPVWLAGYGQKRIPDSKIHDIWLKVLALKDGEDNKVVLVTTDHQGMSKTVYEKIYSIVFSRFGLTRSQFMLTFSHNHCGPRLTDDLEDYYPADSTQQRLVDEYSDWMAEQLGDAVGEALEKWVPVQLLAGQGHCTFAVNRRENVEKEVPLYYEQNKPLKGVVDHSVPVLAVKGRKGKLRAVLFGYACHPTTLLMNSWNGDYPGFAQLNIEKSFPGVNAMFFNACGGDQNPLPRRKVELCEKYGEMLSNAVTDVLHGRMKKLKGSIRSAFEYSDLQYDTIINKINLQTFLDQKPSEVEQRWANRMLNILNTTDTIFPTSYNYPVQAWQLGQLLLIGLGGESVVDYSLKFKKNYPGLTWVSGYTNEMAAYIPSRRVWEEGGYEGGFHINEYGRPAWRWAGDIEDRITASVISVVNKVKVK